MFLNTTKVDQPFDHGQLWYTYDPLQTEIVCSHAFVSGQHVYTSIQVYSTSSPWFMINPEPPWYFAIS